MGVIMGVGSSAGSSRTVRVGMTPLAIPVLIAPEEADACRSGYGSASDDST